MKLYTSYIRAFMSGADFSRGNQYYKQGRVRRCFVKIETDNLLLLEGTVLGNYQDAYTQTIKVNKSNKINILGTCSCPVGYNCKHVVAVCLEYADNTSTKSIVPQKETNELENWLDSFSEKKEETKDEESGEYFITYRLFSNNKNHYNDALQFYKSKFLKNKKISKGSLLRDYQLTQPYYNEDIKNEEDRAIAKLVDTLDFETYKAPMAFEGKFGAILFTDIVKTNRCYYNNAEEPLTLEDNAIKPELTFSLHKGEYSLKSNLKQSYLVLDTSPAYLIDSTLNKAYKFDFDLALYKKLLNSPKITKKDIGKVYDAISKALPNLEIKTPEGITTKTIDAKPIAQIYLRKKSFKLDFNYNGLNVSYEPRKAMSSFYDEDTKIEVKRDLDFEEKAKEKIESFGFEVAMRDNNILVELKEKNKQQQLKVFKEFIDTHLSELEEEGWYIKNMNDFDMKFEANTDVVVESKSENDWFSLSFNLEFNGVSQPIAPLVSEILQEFESLESMPEFINIEVQENHFVELQTAQIAPIIKTIIELMDKKDKDDNFKVSSFDAHMIDALNDDVVWKGSRELLELSKKLKNFKGIEKVEVPKSLTATLRDYQQEGLNWLYFLHEFKFAGILADDMGLGKTIQTLALLSKLKEEGALKKPALIVMPTSLIANWKNEVKKFTPNLRVLSLHGNDRAQNFELIKEHDILLTTYALIIRDKEKFDALEFSYIVLDEAQKIKNPKTKMAMAIKEFKSEHRLALSGTPIENHLGELWSIFSYLMPGFLDTLSFFKMYYQTPIEKEHNFSRQELLNKRVKPFIVRRTKEIVASELPAKSEIIKYTQFASKQSGLYEAIRIAMEEKVRQAVENKGLGSSHITILDALLKLRQVCCDPSLLKLKEAQKIKESAKLELFLDLVDELLAEGRKILVFSQFTSMLSIIEEKIQSKKISYTKLTGSTRKREEAIEKFTQGKADMFLISLKAGGVGLNLVEADTVIHYDPWWNPAVENQATDRAYRIGQTKAVFVYKLIVENTIEQKIIELQKKKQLIQDGIYDDNKQQEDITFSGNELLELLK